MLDANNQRQIESQIEGYLQGRQPYFERTYGKKFVTQMTESERTVLTAAMKRGDLDNWLEETDPIAHISSKVEKRFTSADGVNRVTTELGTRFSLQVNQLLQRSQVADSGVVNVWMNDNGTLFFPNTPESNREILSIGQRGCTQVVLGSRNPEGTQIRLFHYDPTKKIRLCDEIKRHAYEHYGKESGAIIFAGEDEDTSLIEVTLKNALPICKIRSEKMNLVQSSLTPDENIIRVQPSSNNSFAISLKGKVFPFLAGTEEN